MTSETISDIFDQSAKTILDCKHMTSKISIVSDELINCIENEKKIVIFGNGGSAADAQHMAAEFIGRFKKERKSLPAISLTTDSSILTSLANDYTFDIVFSRQCESLIKNGDVVIGISTSGKSKNVLLALETSKNLGAKTILLKGSNEISSQTIDYVLSVPSNDTARIQEGHRVIIHIICELVEAQFNAD